MRDVDGRVVVVVITIVLVRCPPSASNPHSIDAPRCGQIFFAPRKARQISLSLSSPSLLLLLLLLLLRVLLRACCLCERRACGRVP